jgi:endonuclease/exonuclease/phosphatase family metal-dependent hydrolase
MHLRSAVVAIALLTCLSLPTLAQRLMVISWNLESGESSNTFIANRVKTFQGIDLWGLSEVQNDTTASIFEGAAEDGENADFRRVLSESGGDDRLAIIYNATRFTLVRHMELHRVTYDSDTLPPGRSQRSPLVVELRENASSKQFMFMVNHLARGDRNIRLQQAERLNAWVRQQTVPVIATGDYNFDWEVNGGDTSHDAGYDKMTANNAWSWVRPTTLIKSQCDPQFNSVLDFVFVNAGARNWQITSTILQVPGDCQDDNDKPDHRPVQAEFNLSGGGSTVPTRAELLQQLQEVERQLQQLRTLLERLP